MAQVAAPPHLAPGLLHLLLSNIIVCSMVLITLLDYSLPLSTIRSCSCRAWVLPFEDSHYMSMVLAIAFCCYF
jgi:hypothetical protein